MAGRDFKFAFVIGASLSSAFKGSFSSASVKLGQLNRKIEELNNTGKHVSDAWLNKMISDKSYNNAMKRIQNLKSSMMQQKNGMRGDVFQKAITDGTIYFNAVQSLGTAFMAPINAAMTFESSMADVRKVVDFDTPQQFKQMAKDIMGLSDKLPMTSNEIAQIVASAGQSGIAKNELMGFAESAVKMGVAFDTTAQQSGDMMAQWRTAFKMTQPEVNALADKINYLGNNTAASALKISNVVTRIGPLGEVGGVASGEIAALGASTVGVGIEAEVAATGIKNLILGLTAGTAATKKQNEAFFALGLDAAQVAKDMQIDAKGTILDVLTKISQLDKAEQASTLKQLFGKESIGAIAPLLSNLDNLKKNLDMVSKSENYSNSMEKEYQARLKTTGNSVQVMKNRLENAKIAIGNGMLPVVTQLAKHLGEAATAIGNFTIKHPELVQNLISVGVPLIAFIGGLHGLNIVLSGLGAGFGYLQKGFKICKRIPVYIRFFRKLTHAQKLLALGSKVLGAGFTFLTSPIGLVLLGITALIVISYLVIKHWQKVKEFFTKLWNSPLARLAMFLTGPVGWLIAIVAAVIAHWDELKNYFTELWNNPSKAVRDFIDWVGNKMNEAWIKVQEIWGKIQDFLSHPIDATINFAFNKSGDMPPGVMPPGLASGGIMAKGNHLITFAEASDEAAIPLNGTSRAKGLWAETGRRLGTLPRENGTAQAITVNFNPQIVISGDANQDMLNQAMDQSLDRLKRMLQEIQQDQRRLVYD